MLEIKHDRHLCGDTLLFHLCMFKNQEDALDNTFKIVPFFC